jgi:LysM repeat protein
VVLASLVFFAGLVFLGLAHSGASSTTSATQSTVSSVTVHDGDTLWGIAKRIAPGSDPRAVVDRIKSLNHLGSAALQPGQSLVVR